MSQIIVMASGKGGTGKSTVSAGIAVSLTKQGKNVLLIDCDCGMRGLDLMLGIEKNVVFDVSDVVCGNCDYSKAIYSAEDIPGLYLLPAPIDAADEVSPAVMKQITDELKDNYDYVLIDAPAGVGSSFDTAIEPAQKALIVVNAEPTSVRGCLNVRKKLTDKGITDIRLIINRFNEKNFRTMGIYKDLDEVIDICKTQLIGLVPDDIRIAALMQSGCGKNCWSSAGVVFDSIVSRLMGVNVPLSFGM